MKRIIEREEYDSEGNTIFGAEGLKIRDIVLMPDFFEVHLSDGRVWYIEKDPDEEEFDLQGNMINGTIGSKIIKIEKPPPDWKIVLNSGVTWYLEPE